MVQYTATFGRSRIFLGEEDVLPLLFKKRFTDTSLTFSEIISLNINKECKIVEIELDKKRECFDKIVINADYEEGLRGGVKELYYEFNIDSLSDFIIYQ